MTRFRLAFTLAALLTGAGSLAGCATRHPVVTTPAAASPTAAEELRSDLDRILDDADLAGALVGVQVESLLDGRVLYTRNPGARVIPASSLKLVTAAVAAERLGWPYRFTTRLEAAGTIVDGVLQGDLVVVGGGDPTIGAQNLFSSPVFDEWIDALKNAGISRIDGRLIGDDDAFADEPLGAGWAWDYLTAAYAAPSGALSYNENIVAVNVAPGASAGAPADVQVAPPGHGLSIVNRVVTSAGGTAVSLLLERWPGSSVLRISGAVPAGGSTQVRTTTVDNPTTYFVEAFRVALAARGIRVRDGAWDIDEVPPVSTPRRAIAVHQSDPLSSIVGQMLKVSQNFYGEMLIKTLGRTGTTAGSTERGRVAIRETLTAWAIPVDSLVMYDGSGLSRYNYVTSELLVGVLRHVWNSPVLRGPLVAALPVGGHDGTLGARMPDALRGRVQAKTGTISNVRALAGFADTSGGEKLVFSFIANHYLAPNARVDAVMERALERLIR